MIRGSHADEPSIQSQALLFHVVIGYDSSNIGPKLVRKPTAVIAQKNRKTIYQVGKIVDEEGDSYFLQEWSLSTKE